MVHGQQGGLWSWEGLGLPSSHLTRGKPYLHPLRQCLKGAGVEFCVVTCVEMG